MVLGTAGAAAGQEISRDDHAAQASSNGFAAGRPECPGEFQVEGAAGVLCSHGPDAPPPGVDLSRPRSTAELQSTAPSGGAATTSGSVGCIGDGTSGPRVQAVYAHAADVADRIGDVGPLIGGWAANVDASFRDSAAQTGGVRYVRWVTSSSCALSVLDVTVANTGDDSYASTVSELQKQGLSRADRKYLIWMDAGVYCGVSSLSNDDRADAGNVSNTSTGYARIDQACWGQSDPTEAHELMHTLGGVQYSAPHSTGGGHCTDEYDLMCYADASNVTLTYSCFGDVNRLFDCHHDDYFSTAAQPGSYLATHWNTANSVFLATSAPDAAPSASPSPSPSASPTASPSPSASPSAAPVATSSWTGSLTRKSPSVTYGVKVGSGMLSVDLATGKRATMTVKVIASDGSTVASSSGQGSASVRSNVAAGSYSLVVSGDFASHTLTASYTSA
jgi:hypothetical protein